MVDRTKTITAYVKHCNMSGAPTSYTNGDGDDWLMTGINRTRDSDLLTISNFETSQKMLRDYGCDSDDWTVIGFNHWGCGWVDYLVVSARDGDGPDKARSVIDGIAKRLEDYPVLDEDDFSRREYEDMEESWDCWGRDEFKSAVQRRLFGLHKEQFGYGLHFDADLLPDEVWDRAWHKYGDWETGDDGPHFRTEDAVNSMFKQKSTVIKRLVSLQTREYAKENADV